MTTHIGIGFSRDPNTTAAARDAALQAKTHIKKAADFTIVFTTIHYSALEVLRAVRQTLGDARLIGCSTAGIITSTLEMRGIAVLAISSDEIKFATSVAADISPQNIRIAGAELARKTTQDFGQIRRNAFLLFYDGALRHHSFLLNGIQEVLGKVFPILGADSSDNLRFRDTYQFFEDKPSVRSAVAVLLGGQMAMGFASRHGWKPLGKPRVVTKADGPIIKTIDHKKASLLYEEYLGLNLSDLRTDEGLQSCYFYPLGTAIEGEKEYLLRSIVGVQEDGSLISQGEIREGTEIHIMITNKDFLKQAAMDAAFEARSTLSREPKLILIFESLSRLHLLGRNIPEETQAVREIFGEHAPLLGMFSHGVIAPLKSLQFKGESYYNNGSIMIMAIG